MLIGCHLQGASLPRTDYYRVQVTEVSPTTVVVIIPQYRNKNPRPTYSGLDAACGMRKPIPSLSPGTAGMGISNFPASCSSKPPVLLLFSVHYILGNLGLIFNNIVLFPISQR